MEDEAVAEEEEATVGVALVSRPVVALCVRSPSHENVTIVQVRIVEEAEEVDKAEEVTRAVAVETHLVVAVEAEGVLLVPQSIRTESAKY